MDRAEIVVLAATLASVMVFVVGVLWPLYAKLAHLYMGALV